MTTYNGKSFEQLKTEEAVASLPLPNYTKQVRDYEPCSHPGCLSHVTHPCEGCGRMAGRSVPPNDGGNLRHDEQ